MLLDALRHGFVDVSTFLPALHSLTPSALLSSLIGGTDTCCSQCWACSWYGSLSNMNNGAISSSSTLNNGAISSTPLHFVLQLAWVNLLCFDEAHHATKVLCLCLFSSREHQTDEMSKGVAVLFVDYPFQA